MGAGQGAEANPADAIDAAYVKMAAAFGGEPAPEPATTSAGWIDPLAKLVGTSPSKAKKAIARFEAVEGHLLTTWKDAATFVAFYFSVVKAPQNPTPEDVTGTLDQALRKLSEVGKSLTATRMEALRHGSMMRVEVQTLPEAGFRLKMPVAVYLIPQGRMRVVFTGEIPDLGIRFKTGSREGAAKRGGTELVALYKRLASEPRTQANEDQWARIEQVLEAMPDRELGADQG